jgi:hypothetical protein
MWSSAIDPSNYHEYFQHAPKAVMLVESLIIVGASMDDPSLIDKNRKMEFHYLKSPGSLKACLFQVENHYFLFVRNY